jgi:UDP-3-O-[3-hydroxymyristoyl] glucosamine N-acyltransferase
LYTVSKIAELIKARVANESFVHALLPSIEIKKLSTLKEAGSEDVAFFFSQHYQEDLIHSRAAVIVTGTAFVKFIEAANLPQWKNSVFLAVDDPYGAMGVLTQEFSKFLSRHDHQVPLAVTSIHPTAVIGANISLGDGVSIGPYVVIEDHVTIESGVVIYPHCYVGPSCYLGEGTVLFPRVTLYEGTDIGKRCRIHAGVVIGGDGFGYSTKVDAATKLPYHHQKVYHLGNVEIDDDVEIGPNSTIDRGTLGATRIHSKTKIDNLVQIGHNCDVGEGSILCGTAGMAGSSSLGKYVTVGANAGTANQVHVGDYAKLAAYAGAAKDVESRAEMAGVPARPLSDYFRILAIQNKLLKGTRKKKPKENE